MLEVILSLLEGHFRIFAVADDFLMVEGREKRICMDTSNPKNIRARNIPEDIYLILKNTMEK